MSDPSRSSQIRSKEAAITRRLSEVNSKNKKTASRAVMSGAIKLKKAKKYGTITKSYDTQKILGADKGFTKSDYGVGSGAAIPYQIGAGKGKVSATVARPKPKPKAVKPKATSSQGGHSSYKVKKGDTLSGIAKKHGTNWKTIWDYNLKNRSKKTQTTLRKRGPHLIYRGGTFYIPNKK